MGCAFLILTFRDARFAFAKVRGGGSSNRLRVATRNGAPWDANLLVKRKLYPLLDSLGIERRWFACFSAHQQHASDEREPRYEVFQ